MMLLLYPLLLVFIPGLKACIPGPGYTFNQPDCLCGTMGPGFRRDARGLVRNNATVKGTRIAGGENTAINEFPWAVRIQLGGQNIPCGGTLISTFTVLTAAHCISEGSNPANYKVFIRDYRQFDQDGEIEHIVESVEYHEKYDFPDYDYAIITLRDPVAFTDRIYPVCLPVDGSLDKNQDVVAIGWGNTSPNSYQLSLSNILQKVSLRSVEDMSKCGYTASQMLCVIDPTQQQRCAGQGDSGGPAMVKTRTLLGTPYYVQTGITSFGPGDCSWTVFAKVSDQLAWIKSKTTGLQCRRPNDAY